MLRKVRILRGKTPEAGAQESWLPVLLLHKEGAETRVTQGCRDR